MQNEHPTPPKGPCDLEQILSRSPVIVVRWSDVEMRTMTFLSASIAQFGFEPDEFLSGAISFPSIIHPEDQIRVQAEVASFISKKIDSDVFGYRIVTKSGFIRWVTQHAFLRSDPLSGEASIDSVLIDSTEEKKIGEKLRQSEEQYRFITENARDLIVLIDADTRFFYVSPSYTDALGYPREQILQMNPIDLIHPEDLKRMDEWIATQRFEIRVRTARGEWIWLEGTSREVMWMEKKYRLSISHDITARKHADRQLRLTQFSIDKAEDGVLWIDKSGNILFANAAASKRLGYEQATLIGRNIKGIDEQYAKVNWEQHWEELKSRSRLRFESQYTTREGEVFPVEVSANYLVFEGVEYNCSFVRDITARKFVEESLRRYNDDLQELNASKDRFFSIISHDLRSPFSTLLGFSEILESDVDKLEHEMIKRISHNISILSKQIHALLENLLQWSRLQRGKVEFQPVKIFFADAIDSALGVVQDKAIRKEIEIDRDLEDGLYFDADQSMLQSILQNLISNAIKFTPRRGRITVSARHVNDHVCISIRDTGIGMSPEAIENLWRFDVQHTTLGTENEKGTGIGLILCKELVAKHGGTLSLQSEPGKGSDFSFVLPVHAVEQA